MSPETETLSVLFFSYLGIKHFAIPRLAEGIDRTRQWVIARSEDPSSAQDNGQYMGVGKCRRCIQAKRKTFTGPLYCSWSGARWRDPVCRRCYRELQGALAISCEDRAPGSLSVPEGGQLALTTERPNLSNRPPPPPTPMPRGGRRTEG